MTARKFYLERSSGGDNVQFSELNKALEGLEPGRWVVTLEKYRRGRSTQQNRLIHAYFQIIAEETGNSMDTVKSAMKNKFLLTDMKDAEGEIMCDPATGEVLTYVRDTSDLNTVEMMKFTEDVRIFASEFGIILPLPGEQESFKFKNK